MNTEDVKRLKEKWRIENEPFGKALGYPDCCIKEFCDQPPALLERSIPTKNDKRRYKAGCVDGVFAGFIPCAIHAKKIIAGEITLLSLIKNRNGDYPPFPYVQ